MLRKRMLRALTLALCSCGTLLAAGELQAEQQTRPVFMIVHGAWGGGWAFREVEKGLRKAGFEVYRPTLTGLGERSHLASENVGLSTHIQDVVGVLQFEDLHDVVLVGHSYGGIVITGVADRVPERIRQLIYLDALIPEDGDSWQSLSSQEGRAWLEGTVKDHALVPPWVEAGQPYPKDVPHPLRAYTEPIELRRAAGAGLPVTYILTIEDLQRPDADEFAEFAEQARNRGWPVHLLESDHNPQWSAVESLVDVLAEIAAD